MERHQIKAKVRTLLAAQLGPAWDGAMEDSADFATDIGMDSLDMSEFTMAVEDEFGLAIDDVLASTFDTVGKLADWLEEHAE